MRDFHDDWFFDNPDDFGDFECLGNPRKRTAKKGGSAMNDIDFSPMTLLVLGGAVLVGMRLYQGRWLWEQPVARAPISRQLGPGRRVARPAPTRPIASRLSPGRTVADTNVIASVTQLTQGQPLPSGGYSETISIIGR